MATDIQTQFVREAPEIEAQKLALMQTAKAQVDAINAAAQQGRFLAPSYQIAGFSPDQVRAMEAARMGIGAYQPYMSAATQGVMGGQEVVGRGVEALLGADTRRQFLAAQNALNQAVSPIQSMGEAAQMVRGAQLGAAPLTTAAGDISTQSFVAPGTAGSYMSPYMQNVLDIEKREAQRQSDIARQQEAAQFARAGAFGGSRQAIVEAERNRNLATQMGDIQTRGLQSAFQQAQQQFNQEQAARLQASQANQQVQQQAALANQQMMGQYGLQGAQLGLQRAQQLGNIYGQQSQLGQGLAQGIGSLAGQQFGIGQQLAQGLGALGGQQAALGSQLAALGAQQQGLGQQDVNFLYNIGAQQQRQQQAVLDAQRQNQLQQSMQPMQMFGFLSDIYKGAPTTQMAMTQQTQAQASPFQQIAGLGIAGVSAAAAASKIPGIL